MTTPSKRARTLSAALGNASPAVTEVTKPTPEATPQQPSRPRKVGVQVYLLEDDHQRLKEVAFHGKTNLQKIMMEAINLWMREKGHPPVTATTNDRRTGRNAG